MFLSAPIVPGDCFWEAAVEHETNKVLDTFICPLVRRNCLNEMLTAPQETKYDSALRKTIRQAKQVPVLINYTVGKSL